MTTAVRFNRPGTLTARSAVAEGIADMAPISQAELDSVPDYRWKVMAFFEDGDKYWLDAWYCVGLTSDQHEAEQLVSKYQRVEGHHTHLQYQPTMEFVNVKVDSDSLEWMEMRESHNLEPIYR